MARMAQGIRALIRDIRVIRGQKCLVDCVGYLFAKVGADARREEERLMVRETLTWSS